ncbi:hypothetical protein [Nocardia sp. NPDC058633]|uniref:hypothetical protein n=1 Tax=Nocardia sp. NPDC058633 TaxID=3346568 RepID=UPI0036674A77
MIDYEPTRPLDEIPEADRVEQEQSAYRDDDPDGPADYTDEMAARIARDAGSANPADVIEQTIPVPIDEEFVVADEG